MHDARLVKLFERYRSTGDLVALGRVFDTVGPRLLRVARHVAPRGDEAEDLVQATCLAAIEGAARFDAQRPLEPWLVGILVNQARIGHRRRRALDIDVGQPSDPGAGPGAELETQELVGAVSTALEHMPERYREVLEPHLREGLRPLEIAARLHRPQGTVRAQLHRGLRLIRTMLPAGFALGAGALFAPRGWAAVRRNVMAEAERRARPPSGAAVDGAGEARHAAQAAATSNGGVLGLALGVAAAAGLCGALVLFARAGRDTGPRVDLSAAEVAFAGEPARAPEPGVRGTVSGAGRIALTGAAEAGSLRPADALVPPSGSLVVSVVDEHGAALAGERVTITPWGGERWFAALTSTVSARDGSARFDGVPVGRVGVHVEGSNAQARVEVEAGRTSAVQVRGPRAIRVVGRVVDERGRGVGGAALCLARAADDGFADAASFAVAGHSGPDGGFELAAPRGAWLAARLDGRAPSAAAWIDGLRGRGAQALELVLAPGGSALSGTVVDRGGAPLAATLAVFAARADDALASVAGPQARVAADGSLAFDAPLVVEARAGGFALATVPAGPLRVVCEAPGHRPLERVVRLPGEGSGPISLVLEPAARIVGRALDAEGAPCPGASVEVRGARGAPVRSRAGADGAFQVDGLASGDVTITVSRPGFRPVQARLTVDVAAPTRWTAVLAEGETIAGRVQGAGGPVARWLVRAVRERPALDDRADDAAEQAPPAWISALLHEPRDALLQAYTDEDGRFVLPSEPGASYVLELRQRGAWRGPALLRRAGVRSGSDDVRLVLDADAGAVQIDLGRRAASAGLFVALPEDGGSPVRSRASSRQIDPLPPGRYRLQRWPADGPPVDHGTFELGAGEVLALDLARLEAR